MVLFAKCIDFIAVKVDKDSGPYPYLNASQSKQDKNIVMNGGKQIMIRRYSYLGLTGVPGTIKASIKTLEKFGSVIFSSRASNRTLNLQVSIEKLLANTIKNVLSSLPIKDEKLMELLANE